MERATVRKCKESDSLLELSRRNVALMALIFRLV
jgi:hypothetical protein